jgi:outer membrane receptor for Fe3+-dicitrate
MNEPFGSNTNWDLIPNNAISSIQLLPGSNPMFGLNTLGGALSLTTKNGNDDAGMSLKSTVGSFGRKAFQFESGWVNQELGTDHFSSANFDKQDGYRDHSGSDVKQLFGKTRWRGQGDAPNLELSMALADTSMNGTQALPNSMLNNPRSAYTWPDNTSNQMVLVNLKADKKLSENSLFVGNLFYRAANSKSLNSNANYDDGCTSVINEINQCYKDFITGTGTAKNTLTYGTTNPNPYNFARYTDGLNSSIVNGSPKQQTIGTNVQVTNFGKLSDRDNIFIFSAALDFSKITYNQRRLVGAPG